MDGDGVVVWAAVRGGIEMGVVGMSVAASGMGGCNRMQTGGDGVERGCERWACWWGHGGVTVGMGSARMRAGSKRRGRQLGHGAERMRVCVEGGAELGRARGRSP